MTTPAPALLTLTEAAALIPGADRDTLKRRARQGKLRVYRPGKEYLTTEADVARMIEACRVVQKDPDSGFTQVERHGSSSTQETSSVALDAMRQTALELKSRSRNTSGQSTPSR